MRTVLQCNRRWLGGLLLVSVLSLAVVFGAGRSAQAAEDLPVALPAAPNAQILNDDLEVEAGTVYDEDVIVYAGDAKVKDGGVIRGNLVVYSGDISIEEGGLVEGDVSAFSGDIEVQGAVGGNLASWSGDIELKESATVEGDVSVLSGDVDRDDGALVAGNVIRGPSIKLPGAMPPLMGGPDGFGPGRDGMADGMQNGHGGPSFLGGIGRFFGRLFGAFFFALVLGLLTAGVTLVRRDWVDQIERTVREETAISFVVGFVANLALVFLSVVLVITICLWPIPLLTLVAINILGWTGIARIVGRRIGDALSLTLSPALMVGLGAVVLFGGLAPFWAIGGCLRFIAWVIAVVLGSIGTGAFLLPWVNRWRAGELAIPGPPRDPGSPGGETPDIRTDTVDSTGSTENAMATVEPGTGPVAVVPPAAAPETKATAPAIGPDEDDLTAIADIGPVFDKRLRAAGVRTYAQLAAMTPEQIADIIGWPPDRVIAAEIVEQAQALAQK